MTKQRQAAWVRQDQAFKGRWIYLYRVVCLRIGYCQRGENHPGAHMNMGLWDQAMWLSNRDFCHGVERAVLADGVDFAVLNLMSANPGMRWDIDST